MSAGSPQVLWLPPTVQTPAAGARLTGGSNCECVRVVCVWCQLCDDLDTGGQVGGACAHPVSAGRLQLPPNDPGQGLSGGRWMDVAARLTLKLAYTES